MKVNWHRQHKWSGLVCCVLLTVFCVSGILLNHRGFSDSISVPRWLLPPFYWHSRWDGGLLRGTEALGADSVAVFGTAGVWLADGSGNIVGEANEGLPANAAGRNVRAVCGNLMATGEAVYRRTGGVWTQIYRPVGGERLSDLTVRGDTVLAVGRSLLHLSADGGRSFRAVTVRGAEGVDASGTTLFRVVWMLHSGELFGLPGRLVVDLVALIGIILGITGICIWLKPRHKRIHGAFHLRVHRKVGVWSIVLTAIVFATGWMLRPPFMVPLALTSVEAPRGTALYNADNPWHDKLRMARYDDTLGRWLLSTSQGFFSSENVGGPYEKLDGTPPVSVMGLNVWERGGSGEWLCGSFNGLYRWNPSQGKAWDAFTGAEAAPVSGPPIGDRKISGYSADFATHFVVFYDKGTDCLPQPAELRFAPMPLWTAALEAHSGRIYFGESATWFFVLIAGGIALWCLFSGWKVRRPQHRHRPR